MAIYKDKKRNTWFFRVYVNDNKGNRKQKERSGFKTKSEAKIAEINFLNNYNLNANDMTFQELYDIYIQHKEQNLKFQSFRTIKNKFENHILPYFKDFKINSINNKVYIEWKESILLKNLSYKSNSALHICMVGILNYAVDFYDLKVNIASKVGNFSKKDYIPKTNFWTYDEYNNFIKNVDDNIYYALFTTLYYTGMRLGECLALNWNDVKENYIEINKTLINRKVNDEYKFNLPKTKTSIRKVKLDDTTINALKKIKEHYSDCINFNTNWFVFGGIRPLATTTIERKKNYYCKISNVKQIKIHDFRHSHASLLLSNGIPITVISKRLGHADTSTTLKIYSHLIPEDEDKAINLLNNLQKNNKTREFQENGNTRA